MNAASTAATAGAVVPNCSPKARIHKISKIRLEAPETKKRQPRRAYGVRAMADINQSGVEQGRRTE